ncbi:indolepyruvate/phenylpyruvate decarboxylase [Bradyrhizobium japonicum]|uniref:indolepyruvate/phenylpyruvate decarboxylase n=1 Tax=Bradyrhizobium japonicum TaxID=375 RepID=UPI00209D9888|nr:indolepyruvate/phenylpyruvate decarboxylase [Bradyrhizobium japonicum]MCP1765984.1 indolepyruvate decarboxylase [Bradyrhizobium japonicum]MCP1788121.1 indolepyruvate decarboxylase [Bradyrhizobium japonicum]MCP1809997.1 indolepyruvate decarboxylase [Bradyrhizobium japonicum]MCP1818931.1 indolepyruvate decarboxylase [Bradyrhizobium japonicum]MCP1869559.1 indolepyruvate decarboxylase [Bradyrhizobium japonicum]
MTTLAAALLEGLKEHGAREIFGIPGDFVLPFYKAIEESRILPHYTLSHEPGVGFAADAAARYHQGLGVAVVTYGAGAFNLVNAVAGAYAERSPVVVIAGAPGARERAGGFLLHHQARSIDTQLAVFREITCDQAVLDDPGRAPEAIARVLRNAREQSLPVYIEAPRDLVGARTAAVPTLACRPADPGALAECAEEILARLAQARAPVMIVDVEIRRYRIEAKTAKLARALELPVVTTFMGRGLMEEAADVMAGTYLGAAGHPEITRLVEDADAMLLLGVIVSDTNFALSQRQLDAQRTMLAVGREVRVGHHVYRNVPIGYLVDELVRRAPRRNKPAGRKRLVLPYPRGLVADDRPIAPSDVAAAINDLFDRHGKMPMAADMGDCLFVAMEIDNTALAAPGYYAGMGFGVPAGIGVAVATQRRPLVLVGDGAFQMTGWELGNCRRYDLDPIVVLLNNRSWEMLRAFQPESAFNDLDDWHFAEIAPALGGTGERVTTRREFAAALERAVQNRGRFALIEVMLPRGRTSDTLARFVAGFKAVRAPAPADAHGES